MTNSSLISLLDNFSPTEWEILRFKMRHSSSAGAKLLAYLYSIKPFSSNKILEKEFVSKKIFDSDNYNDQKIRDAMAELTIMAKQVIAETELANHPQQQTLLQLQALRKRKVKNSHQRLLSQSVKELDPTAYYHEESLIYGYHLAQEQELSLSLNEERLAANTQALESRMDYLDQFYILAKLKLMCEQLNRMNILQASFQPVLMHEMLTLVATNPHYLEHPGILLYYDVIQMLLQPQEKQWFEKLITDLAKHENGFENEEARNLYRYAQNYCIRMINQGDSGYFERLLQLYQKQLDNKLILPNGIMDHTDYKNIVTVGLRLKNYTWTRDFIAQYKGNLPETVQESAWLYNQANYLYESGQTNEAGDLLVNQNFTDIYYNLSARHLLLKIFYDTDEADALSYQIASFRIYLLRNKTISATNRNSNLNFLKVMKKLATLKDKIGYDKPDQNLTRIAKIEQAIAQYNPLANKNWLASQAQSLKAGILA